MGIWDPAAANFIFTGTFTGDPSVGDGLDNDGDTLPDLVYFMVLLLRHWQRP